MCIAGFTVCFAMKGLEMLKHRSVYAPQFIATFFIYVVTTMVSIVYFMPAIACFLFATIGYILGLYDDERNGQLR